MSTKEQGVSGKPHSGKSLAYQTAAFCLLIAAIVGLAISMGTHLSTFIGVDPGGLRQFWVLQLVLLALFLPIGVELLRRKDYLRILRSPRWMRYALYSLLVYYGANFYIFLYWAADHLSSRSTWRMFSSGWLLLFGIATVYYRTRFVESKSR